MDNNKGTLSISHADRQRFAQVLDKRYISDKVIRTLLLVNSGVDIKEAIFLATGNQSPSHDTVCRIKRESEITLLASSKLDQLATSTYESAMLGRPVVHKYKGKDKDGEEIDKENVMLPQFHHALTAADAIKARTEPIKSQAIAGESKTYIQVNLNDYNAQDIVVEAIDNNDNVIECNDINELQ